MSDLNYLINFDSDTRGIATAEKGLNALSGALAALGVGVGLKELADTADAYTTLAARIKVAVGETGNVKDAMAGVQLVALQTNSDLNATASLFSKITDVGKQMGLTQQQNLDLTKTINQAIQLSGGSAESATAAITQLTQALQSGVLRGDEFVSVSEQAPEVMNALAKSLNVTTGELRAMAFEGKLSSQVVIKALQDQADEVSAKYAQFPKTISQALQNIQTQWQIVVGEFNTESGASKVVVDALQVIGDNLGVLKILFADIGEGVTWFTNKLGEIDPSTITELKRTLETAYDTVKDLASSIGDMAETTWEAFKSLLDSISPVFNAFTSGQQQVSGLDGALRGLQVGMGLLSDGAQGLSIILNALVGGLQFVAGGLAALQAKVASFMGFDDVAKQAELASDRLFAAGEKSLQRAQQQAMDFKSRTREALDDMGKTEEQRNADLVKSTQQSLADKTKAWQDYVLSERNFAKERADLDAQLQQARKAGDESTIAVLLKNISDLDTQSAESAKKRAEVEKDKLDAVQEYAAKAIEANKGVASEQLKAELAAKGYAVAVDEAGKATVSAMSSAKDSTEQLGLSLKDTALNAAKGLGVDVKQALNQVNAAFAQNAESVRQVADGYKQLKEDGLDAGNLLYASLDKLLAGAKSQKEIDTVRQMYVDFGKDGKLSTEQVERGVDGINEKLSKTPELMDETARAFKELGIISRAEAEKQAAEAMKNFEIVKKSGQASTEQLSEALDKVTKKIETSGDASQVAWLNGQKYALGLKDKLDETANSADRVTRSSSAIGSAVESSARQGAAALDELGNKLGSIAAENAKLQAQWDAEAKQRQANNGNFLTAVGQDYSQYSTRSGIEGFLTSAGVDAAKAADAARKLFAQYGSNNGNLDWANVNGLQRGRPMTSQEYANYKSPSKYLDELATRLKDQAAQTQQYNNTQADGGGNISAQRVEINLRINGELIPQLSSGDYELMASKLVSILQGDAKRLPN